MVELGLLQAAVAVQLLRWRINLLLVALLAACWSGGSFVSAASSPAVGRMSAASTVLVARAFLWAMVMAD